MKKKLSVLFIEDDVVETMKLHRTMKRLGLHHKIKEAKNGEVALEILRSDEVLPDIILLDLNMPKINGIEFLRIIKKDKLLKCIPVIILTTSGNNKDLLTCYEIGIAGYIMKPLKYEDYILRLEILFSYWSVNELVKL